MARQGVSRVASASPARKQAPPGHGEWAEGRLTGLLTFRYSTPEGQFVSPGTGRLVLADLDGEPIVALEAARSMGKPVLPGTGIKGAVRSLYELTSSSCNPFHGGCGMRQRSFAADPLEPVCEACSLFGCPGWMGRISFEDARPAGEVTVGVEKVIAPFEPNPEKTGGDFRLYDLMPGDAASSDRGQPPKRVAREVFRGEFTGTLTFRNVSALELGRVLTCLGWRPEGPPRFLMRLGGAKYEGRGAVEVTPIGLSLVDRRSFALEPESEVTTRCQAWWKEAEGSAWATEHRATLDQLSTILAMRRAGET